MSLLVVQITVLAQANEREGLLYRTSHVCPSVLSFTSAMAAQRIDQTVRFADFELDLEACELRRAGVRLPLQGRPLHLLTVLLRVPGQLVSTEQLRTELWPADTFVDFDHGVRNAVTRLRAVLGDAADKPRFIETVPRRGYRFIRAVEEGLAVPVPTAAETEQIRERGNWRTIAIIAIASLVCAGGVAGWRYVRPTQPAGVRIKSLAVLPLENLSGDPAQDHFADGLTEELITALAKIRSIKIISRTSVMLYKGAQPKRLPEIARELDVEGIVRGSVVRTGDRVRVTVQLIEAATDRHIWADRYERSLRDILVLESDIARAIAGQLRGSLNAQEERQFAANPINPSAHEAYLEGLYLWNRRTQPALEEAIRRFTDAIASEPHYALAFAGRANAYKLLGSWAMEAMPPNVAMSRAKADAEQAVRLDPASAEAHAARASIRFLYEWDWQSAESEFMRSIELNPNYAPARQWYGHYLCTVQRFEECLAETARAHSLDPAYLVASADVGYRRYQARRFKEAIGPIQKVLEFNPDFLIGHRFLGEVYGANRMYPEAVKEFHRAVELSGGAPIDIAGLGHALAVSGGRAEAFKALHTLDELAKTRYVSSYDRVLILLGLGENARAIDALERAFQERSSALVHLNVDARLDPLRDTPRFSDLVRRVGLAP